MRHAERAEQLHTDLIVLAPDFQIEDIGAEFGRLRLHLADCFDAKGDFDSAFAGTSGALIDAAVLASQKTWRRRRPPPAAR